MNRIRLKSPAKINLILDILRKRSDGFHEVDFVMQELEVHDTITIESTPKMNEITITSDDPTVPLDARNTMYHAAKLMQKEAEKQHKAVSGVSIDIQKRIPSAGGLGGGSSNGATVLKGLNELWDLHLSPQTLMSLGAEMGSDVPFFIHGGTCRAEGRGEIITPIESCPVLDLAFIVVPVKVPENKTKWIYGNFDVKRVTSHPSVDAFRKAVRENNHAALIESIGNVFEQGLTLPEYKAVWYLIESIQSIPGVEKAFLAGAGPTICVVCTDTKVANQIIAPFTAKGQTAFATRTV